MKSNRVYNAPPVIEDLGNGCSYYNFDVVESTVYDDETGHLNYDYEQVSITNPPAYDKIIAALIAQGYQVDAERIAKVKVDCETLNISVDE